MGSEGAAWVGHAPFTDTRHIFANMGDGTYYHSGLLAIRAAVAANVAITFKILYNDATAATGGQPLPAPLNVPARHAPARGRGRRAASSSSPTSRRSTAGDAPFAKGVTVRHRDHLDAVQRELREVAGVTVLVYDQTCAAEKRRRRKRGKFPDPARRSFINTRVCEGCGDCSTKSNCVSVTPVETEFGRKRAIDQSSCNKDFSCQNGFCPSFVSVEGGRLRRGKARDRRDDLFARLPEPELPALERPYSIVVAGVGGTGIITVGALLGMAAHLEGKGVSVLDMTGVAQKGGAVTTFVRIAARPEDLHTIRIAAGEANAVIGSDLLVTAENSILTRDAARRDARGDQHEPDGDRRVHQESRPADAVGRDGGGPARRRSAPTRRGSSTRRGSRPALLGDSLATNIFLLGYAYQMGLIPVSREALYRGDRAQRRRGRRPTSARSNGGGSRATIRRASSGRRARPTTAVGSDRVLAPDLDAAIARRVDYLTAYQDAGSRSATARWWNASARPRRAWPRGSTRLTDAVARNYFKLLAIKDEYEVARLYTDGEFERQVASAFEGDYRLRYHFAPPLWVKPDKVTGAPVQAQLRTVDASGAGRCSRSAKGLRGTWLDPFGHTEERRAGAAARSRTTSARWRSWNAGSAADNVALAAEIGALPATIRGYGHVKRRNIDAAKAREAALLAQFRTPARDDPHRGLKWLAIRSRGIRGPRGSRSRVDPVSGGAASRPQSHLFTGICVIQHATAGHSRRRPVENPVRARSARCSSRTWAPR